MDNRNTSYLLTSSSKIGIGRTTYASPRFRIGTLTTKPEGRVFHSFTESNANIFFNCHAEIEITRKNIKSSRLEVQKYIEEK